MRLKKIRTLIVLICFALLLVSCDEKSENNSLNKSDITTSTTESVSSENDEYGNIKITKKYDVDTIFGDGEYSYESFSDSVSSKIMNYRLHVPKNFDPKEKYPVVLFLHSASGVGTDNEPFGSFIKSFTVASDILEGALIICPQTPTSWQLDGTEFGDKKGYLSIAKRIVDYVVEKYSGDKNRIYLTGVSLGSFATWNMLDAYPNYFAASVPICGGNGNYVSDSMVNTPIWLFHGTADPIVSYETSKETYEAIIALGGNKVKFTSLEGVDHSAGNHAYTNREMFSWMFSQNLQNKNPVKNGNVTLLNVISQDGEVFLTENDIVTSKLEFALGSCKINAEIKDGACDLFKNQYSENPGTTFSVKIGHQKLYDFKFTSSPTDEFSIISTLEYTVFESLYNAIAK